MALLRNRVLPLPGGINKRLAAYSATGIAGALSITGSEAAIIYTNNGNALLTDTVTTDTSYTAYTFDLNGDGNQDLRFWTKDRTGSATPFDNDALLTAPVGTGLAVDAIGILTGGYNYPARLSAGTTIDGSAGFVTLPQVSTGGTVGWLADGNSSAPGYPNSQWTVAPTNTGYLGIRFKISGNDHYAWMRITVNPQNTTPGSQPRSIIVHEWAFEDVAGTGIVAGDGVVPEPTSLGLLALGSVGLARHRRRQKVA